MKRVVKNLLAGFGLAAMLVAVVANAASIPYFTGPTAPTGVTLNPLDTPVGIAGMNALIAEINTLITPQSMANYNNQRNLLDNGGMQVYQRGTGTRTCGTTTIPSSAYSADRWGCNVNVTSGAGTLQVETTDLPSSPSTFNAALLFYRTSGALAQPQVLFQEIATTRATPMQGQPMTCSFYAKGLANMLAETTSLTAYVMTGTGTDQGLQSFTASPAITPAWTNISSSLSQTFTLTSSWARYTMTVSLPTNETEMAFALAWTPTTGGTAGATDGFETTGVQCEHGIYTSKFEFRPYADELSQAQRYYWQFAETASGYTVVPGICSAQSSTVATCNIPLHVTMRANPTVTCAYGTMKRMVAGTETALSACAAAATTNGVADTDAVEITATVASGDTAGFSGILQSGNSTGGGLITASADF